MVESHVPQCKGHGGHIELSPVDAHLLVPEVHGWEDTLTPVALEITAKAKVTGVSEELTIREAGTQIL